jgi:two-component system cell cycle sensor histidine kinase/response regulator CckA
VFEPFYTTKGPGKGTGLGLAIARNIVIEHGGSIRIESVPGRGTVAAVDLPLWHPGGSTETAAR